MRCPLRLNSFLALAVCLLFVPAVPAQQESNGQYAPGSRDQPSGYDQREYPQPNSDAEQNGYGNNQYQSDSQYPRTPGNPDAQENDLQQSAPAPAYGNVQPLSEQRLEQLVAPIALYPDNLVAQVLAASTYPQQVADAGEWRSAQGYAPADQIVAGANAQSWDPSVKALTGFPEVLKQMDRNLQWVTDLGNAYYNQPQDVLHAVQVMRWRAQAAGNLQSTPQEAVSYQQGNVVLAPANPQIVYVPQYNPWLVYGAPIAPYPGFSALAAVGSFIGSAAIRFGWGIATAAFLHSPFGLLSWGLDWLAHAVLFHGSTYYSHSLTVRDWGFPHGGPRAFGRAGTFPAWNRWYGGRDAYGRGYSPPRGSYWAETASRGSRAEPAIRNPYPPRQAEPPRAGEAFRDSYARSSSSGFHSFAPNGRSNSYAKSDYRTGSYNDRFGSGYRGVERASRSSYSNVNRNRISDRAPKDLKGSNFSRSVSKQQRSMSHFDHEKAPKMKARNYSTAKNHSVGHGHSVGHERGGKHRG